MTITRRVTAGVVALFAGISVLGGCTPGSRGSSPQQAAADKSDVSSAQRVTLTVWGQEGPGGSNAEIAELDRQFHATYPHVTIKRVTTPSTGAAGLKSALSGSNPPDVVEVKQGYANLGAYVGAGLLQPLSDYAKVYQWRSRYPAALLALDSFTPDGKAFGSGNLYGISQTADIVGIYYNAAKLAALRLQLPETWGQFETMLLKIRKAGQLPIAFGSKDEHPSVQIFGVIQDQQVGMQGVRNLVFGEPGASWQTPETSMAAATMKSWARSGYFSTGPKRLANADAVHQFESGAGVFLITGTSESAGLEKAMGANVRFMLPPPVQPGAAPVTMGGEGLAWSISARSKHRDTAAAYLDFITGAQAADVITRTGTLPASIPASAKPQAGTALADIVAAWARISEVDGETPYLGYTTPNFAATIGAGLHKLIDGKVTASAFVASLQRAYANFQSGRS